MRRIFFWSDAGLTVVAQTPEAIDPDSQICEASHTRESPPTLSIAQLDSVGVSASHSGRRTFASRLLAQGQSLDTVQLMLRHAALDHVAPYLEVSRHDRREAVALLGDALG